MCGRHLKSSLRTQTPHRDQVNTESDAHPPAGVAPTENANGGADTEPPPQTWAAVAPEVLRDLDTLSAADKLSVLVLQGEAWLAVDRQTLSTLQTLVQRLRFIDGAEALVWSVHASPSPVLSGQAAARAVGEGIPAGAVARECGAHKAATEEVPAQARTQRGYLKTELSEGLVESADEDNHGEGETAPDIATFKGTDGELSPRAGDKKNALLQDDTFMLVAAAAVPESAPAPRRVLKKEFVDLAVLVCTTAAKAAVAADTDFDEKARPVKHIPAAQLAFLALLLRTALEVGKLHKFPNCGAAYRSYRDMYNRYLKMFLSDTLEGITSLRGPASYYTNSGRLRTAERRHRVNGGNGGGGGTGNQAARQPPAAAVWG
ncbi:hypothetical protein WJX81_005233 [Elliptochloris bilobata]|uniref:Uncharacterized protein n=1 Tax=Elliptochloris bilobata TaxID=381761 RepID=A0AAW1RKQ0_9CHLO